jgi:predicted nucleotidyltransferase
MTCCPRPRTLRPRAVWRIDVFALQQHGNRGYTRSMIDQQEIGRVARRIGQAANAQRVVLFGSHARGEADETSDVDLLIIAESELPRFKRSRELYKLLRPYSFAMDLIVYTPRRLSEGKGPRSHSCRPFCRKERPCMSEKIQIAGQWLAKAENDLLNADNNLAASQVPCDTVCFHCQQAAGRYITAK